MPNRDLHYKRPGKKIILQKSHLLYERSFSKMLIKNLHLWPFFFCFQVCFAQWVFWSDADKESLCNIVQFRHFDYNQRSSNHHKMLIKSSWRNFFVVTTLFLFLWHVLDDFILYIGSTKKRVSDRQKTLHKMGSLFLSFLTTFYQIKLCYELCKDSGYVELW